MSNHSVNHVRDRRLTRRRMLTLSATFGLGAAGLALVGCSDSDDGDAEPAAAQTPAATDEPQAQVQEDEPPLAPAVSEPPADAGPSAVNVVQVQDDADFNIEVDKDEVDAGEITFTIRNDGPLAHDFIVIRTDLDFRDLPIVGMFVKLDAPEITVVAQVEQIPVGETATLVVALGAGNYVLTCNQNSHFSLFDESKDFTVN